MDPASTWAYLLPMKIIYDQLGMVDPEPEPDLNSEFTDPDPEGHNIMDPPDPYPDPNWVQIQKGQHGHLKKGKHEEISCLDRMFYPSKTS